MEWIELGELVDIRKGTKLVGKDSQVDSIRMIMIEDLRNNENIKYTARNEKNILVNEKDIVIAWDGANAGLVGFNIEGAIGSTLARLRLKKDSIHSNYIGLHLQYKFQEIRDNCTGATIPHVNRKHLTSIKIPVPSMEIQKQIVEVLDKVQSLIDKRKEQIKLLDDLIESIFYDMFGDPVKNDKAWEVKKLRYLCTMKSGGTPTRKEAKYFKGNIPWITTVSLDKLYIGKDDVVEFITQEAIEKSATKLIPENSLMIGTRVGVGKLSINHVDMCTNQDITSLLGLKDSFNMIFIYEQLKKFNDYLLSQVRGATIKGINMKVLKDLDINIPPIQLQNKFAEKVELIEEQKRLMEESLKLMEDNYNSIMQRAFKGELF